MVLSTSNKQHIGTATLATASSVNQGYAQVGLSAVALAQAVRSLGYMSIPCMNDTTLNVNLAVDAGLGELGWLGYLITPEFGSHVRIAKVLTNLRHLAKMHPAPAEV